MFKNTVRKIKNKLGFTMVEALVVVGIIAVTTGIAIPTLISVNNNTRLTKRNDYAKAIYMAAQDNLNQMRASGELSLVVSASGKDLQAQHLPEGVSGSSYCYAYSKNDNNPSYDLIVPSSLDASIRNEEVIIEYNPKAGIVYSVFYAEDEDIRPLYNDSLKNHTIRGAENTSEKERKKLGVGYYSVQNVDGLMEAEFEVVHAGSELSFVNDQEGYIALRLPMTAKNQTVTFFDSPERYTNGLEVTLTVTGENGGSYTKAYIANTAPVTEGSTATPITFEYDNLTFTVVVNIPMDSLWSNGSFIQKTENLNETKDANLIAAGDNVTVTADVTFYPTAAKTEGEKDDPIILVDSATLAGVNPMFHSLTRDPMAEETDATPYILAISNGRHLQNLQHLTPAFANKIKTIVFTHPEETEGSTSGSQTGTTAKATGAPVLDWAETAQHYKSGNTVNDTLPRNLNPIDFAGISANGSVNTSIRKLVIDGNNVTIQNLIINSESTAGVAGLFGKLSNVEVKNIKLLNPNVVADQSRATGALAGETHNVTISQCSVTNDQNTVVSGKYFVGGLIGSAQKDTNVDNCTTTANVNGAGGSQSSVGGLVGYATEARFTNCKALDARVESGSKSLDDYHKHILGGLVGEAASKAVFLGCSTNSKTTVTSFQDATSDAGGFVGYAYDATFGSPNSALQQCTSYAEVRGNVTSNTNSPIPNNNIGGFVGKSESATYYNPKVYQSHLPQYARDAGGFAGLIYGGDIYDLYAEFSVPESEALDKTKTVTNFGGIASVCSRDDNHGSDIAKVYGATVKIFTEIWNVQDLAAGAFATLSNSSIVNGVQVQSAMIAGANQIGGFAVYANNGAQISESYFWGQMVDNATGFVRNNNGDIKSCYANPLVNNGFAFVRENSGKIENCFAWAGGTGNTVAVTGSGSCSYSYFGSYDRSSLDCLDLAFYEATASNTIADTEALADAWAVDLLNHGVTENPAWTTGDSGYPYPTLVKSDRTVFAYENDMGHADISVGVYPYALIYVEDYSNNESGHIVVEYYSNGDIADVRENSLSADKVIDGTKFYLCHRTQDGLGKVFTDRTDSDFDTVLNSFGLQEFNRLFTIYELTNDEDYNTLKLNTCYPLYDESGAYRIRTAGQFDNIETSGTFYVDRNITVSSPIEVFGGTLYDTGDITITAANGLVDTLTGSGTLSGLKIVGLNAPVVGSVTGGTISGCTAVTDNDGFSADNSGLFAGTVVTGTLTDCDITGANPGKLPFAKFASYPITEKITHWSTDVLTSGLLRDEYFNSNFHPINADTPLEILADDITVTGCTINGLAAVTGERSFYEIDTEKRLIELDNNAKLSVELKDENTVTFYHFWEIARNSEKAVQTGYYTSNGSNGFTRVYVKATRADTSSPAVSSEPSVIDETTDGGTTDPTYQYTFQFQNSNGAALKDPVIIPEDQLNEYVYNAIDLVSISKENDLFSISSPQYLLHCDSGFLAYDDGSFAVLKDLPSGDASACLWVGHSNGGWRNLVNDAVLTIRETDTETGFTHLINIASSPASDNIPKTSLGFYAQYARIHFGYILHHTASVVNYPD